MKRSERHHLKENPIAQFAWEMRELTIGHSRQATLAAVAVAAVIVAVAGYYLWQARRAADADALLATAMNVAETPVVPQPPDAPPQNQSAAGPTTYPSERARLEAALPKYLSVLETYPSSKAATTAAYQAANALAALGRLDEAASRYQEVVTRDGNGIYAQMAKLGLADVHQTAGRLDKAIEIYQAVSTAADTRLPIDGVLLQLARAYARAGKTDEAARTYTRIVEEFPQSLYATDAREALSAIKKS